MSSGVRVSVWKRNWEAVVARAAVIVSVCSDMQDLADHLGVERRGLAYHISRRVRPARDESLFEAFKRLGATDCLSKTDGPRTCDFCGALVRSERNRFCGPSCAARWRHEHCGFLRPRWSKWRETFFDVLTPDSAYILGFIIADGAVFDNITGRGSRRYAFAIHQAEPDILLRIARVLDYCGSLPRGGDISYLLLGSKHAWEVLVNKYGIPAGAEKGRSVRLPSVIRSDTAMLPHFIRGLFDGDGYVSKDGYQFGLSSGSPALIDDFVDVMVSLDLPRRSRLWMPGNYTKKDGTRSGCWFVRWSAPLHSMRFARFIYGSELDIFGSDLFLRRKFDRFAQLFAPWRDPDWLYEEFVVKGRSTAEIAGDFDGVRGQTVGIWVSRYGLREQRVPTRSLPDC